MSLEPATKAETEIRQIANEWRATLDALSDLVILVEKGGRVLRINRTAEIWGLGPVRDLPGRDFHDVLHPICHEPDCYLRERWQRLTETDDAHDGLVEREFEDHHLGLRVRLTARRIDGDTAARTKTSFAVLVLRDVTVYHHRQVTLTRSEWVESTAQLVRGIAHEIGNPLATMKTSVQVLVRNFDRFPREKQVAYLERIDEGTERIRTIIDTLLRDQQWKIERLVPISIRPVCLSLGQLFGDEANEQRLQLEIRPPGPELVALGDGEALDVVLAIVLTNAMEACVPGDGILVAATHDDREVRIKVKDSGCGIPEGIVDRVFQSFFTTKPKATGVGLTQAHQLMEQMNGRIEIHQNEPKGTAVSVVLAAA